MGYGKDHGNQAAQAKELKHRASITMHLRILAKYKWT
jgi:hypothetical protein